MAVAELVLPELREGGRESNTGTKAKVLQHHSVTCGYVLCPVASFWSQWVFVLGAFQKEQEHEKISFPHLANKCRRNENT